MSVSIMGKVYDIKLPSNEQAVLLALADHADHLGRNIYPSNGLVAWKLGMSEDTVSRLKKKLESRGILILVSAVSGHVKEYRIDLGKGEQKEPFKQKRMTQNMLPDSDSTPPQDAGRLQANPPATEGQPPRNGNVTPPQPKANPPAELCGPNQGTVKNRKKKDASHPTSGDHAGFIKAWVEAYQNYFKCEYKFSKLTAGRDGKAVNVLLAYGTITELIVIAAQAWKQAAIKSYPFQNAYSIHGFANQYNQIVASLAQPQQSFNPRRGVMPPPRGFPGAPVVSAEPVMESDEGSRLLTEAEIEEAMRQAEEAENEMKQKGIK